MVGGNVLGENAIGTVRLILQFFYEDILTPSHFNKDNRWT